MKEQTASFALLLALGILYGLVILGVVAVIVTALFRVQIGHSTTLRNIFKQTRFLELTTVLVIIISGTYLAWSDKLSDGIVALLSGIAGYVLGGLGNAGFKEEESPSTSAATKTPVQAPTSKP
jgi:hypothetical protein